VPLLLLAVAFLVAYAWPILDPRLDPSVESFLAVVSWTVWAAFALDFLVRLALAERRGSYALRHWYDVALIALPMMRPLRLLRLLTLARFLGRTINRNLAGRVTVYVVGTTIASLFLAALAILDVERGQPGANITTLGDAIWWSFTTVTTVGYGDYYPVTTAGRLVAVALSLVGIALIGSITAAIASWFVEQAKIERTAEQAGTELTAEPPPDAPER